MRAILPLLPLILAAAAPSATGFIQNGRSVKIPAVPEHTRLRSRQKRPAAHSSPSALFIANPITAAAKSVTPLLSGPSPPLAKRVLFLLVSASLILSKVYKKVLWPGSGPDKSVSAPLPPSAMGCPLFGVADIFAGTKEDGPLAAVTKISRRLGNPGVLRLYAFGHTLTSVSGLDNVKAALRREFEPDGVNTMAMSPNWSDLFGGKSVLYEGDKKAHGSLRRLVGSALSPAAVDAAVPAIKAVADQEVDKILRSEGGTVKMEDVATDYTLDVAHRQILGLDLKDGEEVDDFCRHTKNWLAGMTNPVLEVPFRIPGLRFTKGFRGRDYLVSKVEEKLERLDRDGPDDTTLSKMYFATDEDGAEEGTTTPRKLTREEVIDNSLILIVAGTETSASTLSVASLLLGLHPHVWQKLKEEQKELRAKYGDSLNKAQLAECTYLEAFIKETMRIRPIPIMEPRRTKETLVIEGSQIPKGDLIMPNVPECHARDPATFVEDGSHMDLQRGFDPDRWLDKARTPTVFMGFGEGGRRCLGERLAMTEMKIFLATLARKVDFDLKR